MRPFRSRLSRGLAALASAATLLSAVPAAAADVRDLSMPELRKRAEAGDIEAQSRLGQLYAGSSELGYDEVESVKWLERAATAGHPEAQVSYASRYLYGRGVPNDMTQARVWYERAAEQGNDIGQFNTAIAYELGDGAPKDLATAYVWFTLAARTGTPDQAAQRLYERKRDEVRAQLSASDRAEAEARIKVYQERFDAQKK
jgi:TPR repeat protein